MAQQDTTAAGSGTQTTIEGVQPPPPPRRTRELVEKAVLDFVTSQKLWSNEPAEEVAEQIAEELTSGMNGYELARALDDHQCWSIDAQDVENLDCVDGVVRDALRQARKQWAREWNIQPPHPMGTRVKFTHGTGVIAGVSAFDGAVYLVKRDGCTQEGRHSLVNFEDAIAPEGGAA